MLPNKSFGNKTYDVLKYIALVVLPAIGALYFGLAGIWDLPKVNEVLGTIAVLDTVLGLILKKSNDVYMQSDARFDGKIEVEEREDGGKTASMVVEGDPEQALEKQELTFKVDGPQTPVDDFDVQPKRRIRNQKGQFTKE